MKTLKEITDKVYVVAHKEDTTQLEAYFRQRGFIVTVSRRNYTPEEQGYVAQMRCLINHRDVWTAIAASGSPGIVVEADFVPVENLEKAAAPFDPDISPKAIAWLYAGGPVLYGFDEGGYAIGHSSTTVALMITAEAATSLIEFADHEIKRSGGGYLPWDTYLSHDLRKNKNVPTYIPFKQYGEHGGKPNTEHGANGIRSWHQADILMGSLAFLPTYADGSRIRYLYIRIRARLRGLARILLGRYIEIPSFRTSDEKWMIVKFTFSRWLPWKRQSI